MVKALYQTIKIGTVLASKAHTKLGKSCRVMVALAMRSQPWRKPRHPIVILLPLFFLLIASP